VGEDDFQLGEIDGDIIEVHRVAIFIARARKNRCTGVEHDGDSVGLGGTIDDFEFLHSV
jgi:hypothetical protein